MNITEYLVTCLGEEGCEIAQDASKSTRFGLSDVNVTKPDGPTNRERIIDELNDLLGVVSMLIDIGVLPADWVDAAKIEAKKRKVLHYMIYARNQGSLQCLIAPNEGLFNLTPMLQP